MSTHSGTVSGTVQILPGLSTQTPKTSGTVITSLITTAGEPTSAPLLSTSISTPTTTLVPTKPASSIPPPKQMNAKAENIFQPIDTAPPPEQIGTRSDHPVPRLNIMDQNSPISTNKFYSNFFLGSQTAPAWTHPYSLAWSKGEGNTKSWGMVITHLDDNQKVFGPDPAANPVQYFANPISIQSIVISALELGSSTVLTTNSLTASSVNVELHPNTGAPSALTFPLVQGMGFVTAGINMVTPIIQSGVFFRSVTKSTQQVKLGVTKYTIKLEDDRTWLLYAISDSGVDVDFKVVDNGLIQATSKFQGIIQITKNPSAAAEALYDSACGVYPMTATVSGNVEGAVGSYSFSFLKQGMESMMGAPLLMYALPHHVASFSDFMRNAVTGVQLPTTTKGQATAVLADSWTFTEGLPITLGFTPWRQETGETTIMSSAAIQAIHGIATTEISQNINEQSNLSSMYFSGKALAKFAGITYTLNDLLSDQALAQEGLQKLKDAFALFTSNRQQFPLVYETAWKGVVSTASYVTGDPGVDFGNSYYNDHHFHYGYYVYAAAIIGHLDPSWLDANKAWVNTLVRDYANPSPVDHYFPVSRSFDWYHGHSFAHGLYESFDGRDQESSSEDSMSSYALKLWGRVTGNSNLEAVANIQLAVTARSLQSYFLYTSSNAIQPLNFIPNKVSGILFENKIHHATYFGMNTEYIQGIHMLPILPHSTLTRTKQFVQEEWDAYFSNGRAEQVQGSWRGVLFSNLVLIDPRGSWNFFARGDFDASWLDGGASRTWCLAMAAGMGGGP
ncbi:glycoside hydrolase family 81 protein [Tricladium varicosporioides]|nr:glycoside hydrolase family 81 protein [Hymenoscyphus varicosporioides]